MPFLYPVLKTYGQGPFGTLTIGLSRGGSEGRFAPVKGDIAFLGEYQVSQTGIPLSETYILNVDIASFEGNCYLLRKILSKPSFFDRPKAPAQPLI